METAIPTMLAVAAFFALVLTIAGVLFRRRKRAYAGRSRRAIANLLFAVGLLVFAVRSAAHLPDWIGVVGANAVVAAAGIFSLEATREYRGMRPWAFPAYAGGILAVLAVVYFDYVVPNLNARIFAMSAFLGVVAIFSSVTLLRVKRSGRTLGVSVSAGMFALAATLLMARAIYFLFAPPLLDLFTPTWVNGAFFVGCALSIACCSIGWDGLMAERALLDLKEADSRAAFMQEEIGELKRSEEELRCTQARLTNLPAALFEAQEAERRLLARELHDNFGQTLAALSMEAATLPQSSRDLAQKIGGLAADAQRMSQQLHPAVLDDLGVAAALQEECAGFSERLGIPVSFQAQDVRSPLPKDVALCLYRVAQESLDNIAKHAGAKEVWVRLASANGGVALFIEDIGNGCSVEQARGNGGLGLISMEERVRMINGSFQIRSQPGEGTKVEVHVPLPRQA